MFLPVAEAILGGIGGALVPDDSGIVKKKKNPGRSAALVVKARQHRLYKRQLVLDHAAKEGVCEQTAWFDWRQVNAWNEEDWQKDRENMISRLQSMRVKLFEKAVRKGQLQTAAQILDSLGKVVGESVETVNINAPELAIRVEAKPVE